MIPDDYVENIIDLKKIPRDLMQMLVFSTDFIGLFAYLIRVHTHSIYSHFMWYHEPGNFASQQFTFSSVPVEKFAKCKLKLVYNPTWNSMLRALLLERIYIELEKPKWQTRYDWVNIIGQFVGLKTLQNPWTNICSETAGFLKLIDEQYRLCNPTPDDVNRWVKQHPHYQLYTRYSPD